jgi:hypothetical protein
MPQFMQRSIAVLIFGGCASMARAARRRHLGEWPGDDYA